MVARGSREKTLGKMQRRHVGKSPGKDPKGGQPVANEQNRAKRRNAKKRSAGSLCLVLKVGLHEGIVSEKGMVAKGRIELPTCGL